jgi:hypothetical protein
MFYSNKTVHNILVTIIPSFIVYYGLSKLLDFIPCILHKKRHLGWKGSVSIIGHRGSRNEVNCCNKFMILFNILYN